MLKKYIALASLLLNVVSAHASVLEVYPGDPSWVSVDNSGGGSSAITVNAPHSGTGSLELTGDKTRFVGLGNQWDQDSNLGLLSNLTSFSFDWMIASGSTSELSQDYTPALRLHVWDDGVKSELIWEGAYNGTYGSTDQGTWYTTNNTDNFWQWVTGVGVTLDNGAQINTNIEDWAANYFSDDAYVAGVSVGVGSTVGSGYHAYADNVILGFNGESTTYNFEAAAVPLP